MKRPRPVAGLTEREFALIGQITAVVAKLTETLCGCRVAPGASLMRAIPVYRAVKKVIPDGGTVFELGPGSGYVGALVVADGYRYGSTDVAQAFFLWQQHLLRALRTDAAEGQIPWWDWLTRTTHTACEVFTANHMLNEMHANAQLHTVRVAKEMLGQRGIFLVENFGSTVLRSNDNTRSVFTAIGVSITEVGAIKDGLALTRGWSDLEALWAPYGGAPQSADEKFMAWLGYHP